MDLFTWNSRLGICSFMSNSNLGNCTESWLSFLFDMMSRKVGIVFESKLIALFGLFPYMMQ